MNSDLMHFIATSRSAMRAKLIDMLARIPQSNQIRDVTNAVLEYQQLHGVPGQFILRLPQ